MHYGKRYIFRIIALAPPGYVFAFVLLGAFFVDGYGLSSQLSIGLAHSNLLRILSVIRYRLMTPHGERDSQTPTFALDFGPVFATL